MERTFKKSLLKFIKAILKGIAYFILAMSVKTVDTIHNTNYV